MPRLLLPYPPSVNKLYRGRRFRTKAYDAWALAAQTWLVPQKWSQIKGPYKLTIQAVRPDKRKRDLGNILKATEDLLVSCGAVEDDSLCEMISMRWVTSGDPMTVFLEPAGVEVEPNKAATKS